MSTDGWLQTKSHFVTKTTLMKVASKFFGNSKSNSRYLALKVQYAIFLLPQSFFALCFIDWALDWNNPRVVSGEIILSKDVTSFFFAWAFACLSCT